MLELTQQLLKKIQSGQVVLATVESCTGGLIADQITNIAGSSENFWGSWTVYDNSAKIALGVPQKTLEQYGAVSSQTAATLAEAGLKKLSEILTQTDPAMIYVHRPWKKLAVVATTGIAGPSGGSPEKPVGLCFVGVAMQSSLDASPSNHARTLEVRAPSGLTRIENKQHFANHAIQFLNQLL
jgi:PncC family amidohydrolase